MLQSSLEFQTKTILNNNQYNSIRRLGKGGFGHVLLATKATSSTTFYAVKCISKKKMIKDCQLKKFLIQEIKTMATLDHINIVKLYRTFEQGDWHFLVMEYCDIGNLYNFQSKQPNKVFSLFDSTQIFSQILEGVEFIHSHNIIHRDLKLQNIFLKKNAKNTGYICKIGDFGLAREIGDEETAITNCGTESYMAPEILSCHRYDKQADIWSLGVLLYYLLFGEFPFKGINILNQIDSRCKTGFKLIENLKNKNYFKSKKEESLVCDFFERIFRLESNIRITIKQMMQHPLLCKHSIKMTVEELTTAESENEENIIQWQIERIKFIQRIVMTVEIYNCLSLYLLHAFKFYINKVLLYFLNREHIQNYKNDQESNPRLVASLKQFEFKIFQSLKLNFSLLNDKSLLKEPIQKFQDGFNLKIEDFTNFKMSYRNTVGKVYEQVHKKLADNSYQRSALKLKIFFCHIINRVFTGNVNASIFPYYLNWVKKNNKKISQKFYDFQSIEEWISNEKPQNLQRSQDTINQIFYK